MVPWNEDCGRGEEEQIKNRKKKKNLRVVWQDDGIEMRHEKKY